MLENMENFCIQVLDSQALDSVRVEIQPVQKPEKQNRHQNHDHEKQPAQKPDLPLVRRKPAFISMSVHKKLSNQTTSKSHA